MHTSVSDHTIGPYLHEPHARLRQFCDLGQGFSPDCPALGSVCHRAPCGIPGSLPIDLPKASCEESESLDMTFSVLSCNSCRPGGNRFEVVRPRTGFTRGFIFSWGLGYGMCKHALARWVWGHAPPGKF